MALAAMDGFGSVLPGADAAAKASKRAESAVALAAVVFTGRRPVRVVFRVCVARFKK